jgi:ketosteroid isomerase-like protein
MYTRKPVLAFIYITIAAICLGLIGCESWIYKPVTWPAVMPESSTPAVTAPKPSSQETTAAPAVSAASVKETTNPSDEDEVRAASDRFYAATNALLAGNYAPMDEVWSHSPDVTNMSISGGGLQVGWKTISATFERQAKIKAGGRVIAKDLVVHLKGDLAYTQCVEDVETAGSSTVTELRASNIFRLENGNWKLVHHHTEQEGPALKPVEEKPAETQPKTEPPPAETNETHQY